MPEHYHLVVDLNDPAQLHVWLRDVQGHSGTELSRWLRETDCRAWQGQTPGSRVWKEQARALGIISESVLRTKIDYLHANPVRRGLAEGPGDWPWTSWRNYYLEDDSAFRVDRVGFVL